jgi:hypothetical protein
MIKKLTLLTAIACLAVATANAGWLYLVPDYSVYGLRDQAGVLHCFQADQARYDQRTRVYQILVLGRWLTVGEDVFQLTD